MFDSSHTGNANGASTPLNPCVVGGLGSCETPRSRTEPCRQELSVYLLSNLFGAGYMGKAKFARDRRLVCLAKNKRIFFTGERLDQWDLDVLLHCALRSIDQPGGIGEIQVDAGKLLCDLRLRNYDQNRERVYASLFRLHTGALTVDENDQRHMIRLVDRVLLDQSRGRCVVEVNRGFVKSLRCERHRGMDIETRGAFKRCGLAKWLHGAVTFFNDGFKADITELHQLCGASNRSRYIFARLLDKALELMAESGVVDSWKFDGSRLTVSTGVRNRPDVRCGEIVQSSF